MRKDVNREFNSPHYKLPKHGVQALKVQLGERASANSASCIAVGPTSEG